MIISEPEIILFDNEQYVKICPLNDVFEGKGKQVLFAEDDDFQIAVFKVKGKIYAVDNICPHRHADRIFEGIIKDCTVMCPLHGWTYSLENGQNINQKQGIKSLKSYEVKVHEDFIFIKKPEFEIPKWRR